MKTYKKLHKTLEIADNHLSKIKNRGGSGEIKKVANGYELTYQFNEDNAISELLSKKQIQIFKDCDRDYLLQKNKNEALTDLGESLISIKETMTNKYIEQRWEKEKLNYYQQHGKTDFYAWSEHFKMVQKNRIEKVHELIKIIDKI